MERRRQVKRLLSVFDIINHSILSLPKSSSIRVMYEYDEKADIQKIEILDRDITKESCDQIVDWLKNNISAYDIIYGLESNELDLDNIIIPVKCDSERMEKH